MVYPPMSPQNSSLNPFVTQTALIKLNQNKTRSHTSKKGTGDEEGWEGGNTGVGERVIRTHYIHV